MSSNSASGRQILRRLAQTAMLEHGLLPDFSAAAMRETSAFKGAANPPAVGEIRDLRHLLWASIDNDDSLDLDQLSVAEPRDGGAVCVWVAIADVDALVHRGSAIDDHARHNTASVYTAGHTFPMLPERLSTDLTSLRQGEERLAVVAEMVVDTDGRVSAVGSLPGHGAQPGKARVPLRCRVAGRFSRTTAGGFQRTRHGRTASIAG